MSGMKAGLGDPFTKKVRRSEMAFFSGNFE